MVVDQGVALIAVALINIAGLVVVALINLRGVAYSRRTLEVAETTEKNTNSMKDALVAATEKAAFAAGQDDMREENQTRKD